MLLPTRTSSWIEVDVVATTVAGFVWHSSAHQYRARERWVEFFISSKIHCSCGKIPTTRYATKHETLGQVTADLMSMG